MTDPEPFVAFHGEQYRRLIEDALRWLDEAEPKWGLEHPIDRNEFVGDLVLRAQGIKT